MARFADGSQGRYNGKAIALTTLSPVRRERRAELDRRLRIVSSFPPLGRPLAELSFIHYARWTVLEAVPKPDGSGGRRQLASSYLLFESNYNGGLTEYLDTFTAVIPHRLARLWGTCFQFEETVQRADGAEDGTFPPWAFRRYVAANELTVLHFHAAYPEATMIDVRQALAVAASRRRAERLSGSEAEAEERRIVPLVVGPEPERLVGVPFARSYVVAQWRALRRRYGVNPFTLLTPVHADAAEGLFERLRSEWIDEDSPLSRLPDTHYARLVRLPPDLKDLGQLPRDDVDLPYLLYTSNHCGSADEHIRNLRSRLGPVADEIWEHCPRYPGHDDAPAFDEWARRHTVDTRYFVAGYTPHEVAYVKQALADRDEMQRKRWGEGA